jgi:hypothetical protein
LWSRCRWSHVLLHEGLDVGRALHGAEAANPLAVGGEQARVGGEVASVERAPVFEQHVLNLFLVGKPLQPRFGGLLALRGLGGDRIPGKGVRHEGHERNGEENGEPERAARGGE